MEDFSEVIKDAAYRQVGGRCQCQRKLPHEHHKHHKNRDRCLITLQRPGRVRFHHINSNGPNTVSNCEVLCVRCHKGTRSYGVHK